MSFLSRVIRRGLQSGRLSCRSFPSQQQRGCGVTLTVRTVCSSSPINLTYDVFDGKGESTPLVFLHGLFGSKSNFHSIAKSLVQRTGRKVLTVDARNHGTSPHSTAMSYEAMAGDLKLLLTQLRIEKCVLIGHSMGGKTAMTTALTQPALVERLVVVDISPAQTTTRTNFRRYIQAMQEMKISSDIPRSTARRMAFFLRSSDDFPEIQRLFPCADIQYIPDASHWIHADKPLDFISSIISFLQS